MTRTISATGYLERIGTRPDFRPAELIWIQATAARIRIACEKMTTPALGMLRDSVEHAASLPTKPGWERKAAAHAEIFRLLAEIAGDRAAGSPGGAEREMETHLRALHYMWRLTWASSAA